MNTGGEAAEQIVRMSLEGFEVAARITGAGAKNIAILLYSILKMVSSRYGVDTRGFSFGRLPKEYEGMDMQAFKGELSSMRDVLREIQSDMYVMYKSMEKNKPPKS